VIITSSSVKTESSGSYQKSVSKSEKFTSLQLNTNYTYSAAALRAYGSNRYDTFTMRDETESDNPQEQAQEQVPEKEVAELQPEEKYTPPKIKDPYELKMELIKRMFEYITKGRIKFDPIQSYYGPSKTAKNIAPPSMKPAPVPTVTGLMGFTRTESTSEKQSVTYMANGAVNTADGKTISFSMSMSMSRSVETFLQVSDGLTAKRTVLLKNQVDPLIINYGGTAASLTNEKYEFDLDSDGKLDKISFAGAGSGFLALDKNEDGIINDGNELFGPQSGDGFAELRKYDKDGNGWIDEADEVYSQLKVWCKDKDGKDVYYTLKELDIGAIYLTDTKTEFGMFDAKGNEQGNMRSSSFYLKDSGGMGVVSHFDLTA